MGNLIHNIEQVPKDKKLIVFDLDGTLADSKQNIDDEMASLLLQLLEKKQVAIIGGGKYELFQKQLLSKLNLTEELSEKLFLFPTNSTLFYRHHNNNWEKVYSHDLTHEEKKKIFDAFDQVFTKLNYILPEKIYGEVIEDRGTQITFSALGQEAPLELKNKWKEDNQDIKLKMVEMLQKLLPSMEVRSTGLTSIDVNRKGMDKEYGIKQIKENLDISIEDMIFVGDAFSLGTNDSPVLKSGILSFEINSVEETKKFIRHLVS